MLSWQVGLMNVNVQLLQNDIITPHFPSTSPQISQPTCSRVPTVFILDRVSTEFLTPLVKTKTRYKFRNTARMLPSISEINDLAMRKYMEATIYKIFKINFF